jgi:PDZ domain/Aspartyl protease
VIRAWWHCGLALVLLLAAAGAGAEPVPLQLQRTGDIGVLLGVEGRLGDRPMRWLIDSGSSHNLVALSVPAAESVPAQQLRLASAAGRLSGTRVELGPLHIGAKVFEVQSALRLDLAAVLGPLAPHVDGVLGMPFLQGRRIAVDLSGGRIDFDATAPATDAGVALERVQGMPVLTVQLQGRPQRLLFDTGAAGGVVRLQRGGLFSALRPGVEVWLAPQLLVAGVPRQQVPVADLPGSALGRALPADVAGALGMAVLKGCRFTLDLASDRFVLHGCDSERLPGGYGLQWATQDGQLRLAHVWPDSPAARAGLRAADRVRAIDGRPAPTEVPDADALLAAGTQLRLQLERDGRTLDVTLQRAYFLPPLPER